jgi:hypothetical protein
MIVPHSFPYWSAHVFRTREAPQNHSTSYTFRSQHTTRYTPNGNQPYAEFALTSTAASWRLETIDQPARRNWKHVGVPLARTGGH